jgi:hypothetical protein
MGTLGRELETMKRSKIYILGLKCVITRIKKLVGPLNNRISKLGDWLGENI